MKVFGVTLILSVAGVCTSCGKKEEANSSSAFKMTALNLNDVNETTWKSSCILYRPAESGDRPIVESISISEGKLTRRVESYREYDDGKCQKDSLEVLTLIYEFQLDTRAIDLKVSPEQWSEGERKFFLPNKSSEIVGSRLVAAKLRVASEKRERFGYKDWQPGEEKDVLDRVEYSEYSYVNYPAGSSFCPTGRCALFLDEAKKKLSWGYENSGARFSPYLSAQMVMSKQ